MAVIVNTAQGIGQPIRGTCLTSLGSTGIVAAYWNGIGIEHNTLVVPEFGTSLELTVYSTLASPTVSLTRAWAQVASEASNPLRNWPEDVSSTLATNNRLWVQLPAKSFSGYALVPGSSTVRASLPQDIPLRGATQILLEVSGITATNTVVCARFVN